MHSRGWGRNLRRLIEALALAAAFAAAPALAACSVGPGSDALGSFSPAALKATGGPPAVSAAPYVAGTGGFSCTNASVLTLSLVNYLKATIPTATVLKLTSATTTDQVTFQVAAASNGGSPLTPGTPFYFVQGLSLNLLGLGSTTGPMTVPIYIKPATSSTGALIAPGTYTGTFPIAWDWYFCSGVYVTGCSVTPDGGTGTSTVTVTLTVAGNAPTMTISSVTTWDTVESTTNPKALPGSKRRTTVTVTNPDIVALAAGTVQIVLPTAAKTAIALDGDGTGSAVVQTGQGSTASGLSLTYTAPASTSDDVDFSYDNGVSWTAYPIAGDAVTQGQVTTVRFRPQGTMAAGSSFSISLPYSVQ